jgi:ribosome-associated translation inhibitor RaiA
MLRTTTLLMLLMSGCAPYFEAQSALLIQTRKGIDKLERSLDEKSQFVRAYHETRREQLDEAFDQDVRQRPQLTADWVIEHRRAYSSALDAITTARSASIQANESDVRTLAAIRAAIDRIEWLQSLQLRITGMGESDE